jgi:hypothetical protein
MSRRTSIQLGLAIIVLMGLAPAGHAASAATGHLFGSVSRTGRVSLRNGSGHIVRTVPAGSYLVTVRDRSRHQNFHLLGAASDAIDKKTGIGFVGTVHWTLSFQSGVYDYYSDHLPTRRAVLRVTG